MNKYNTQDLKEWLAQEPSRQQDLPNWAEIYNQLDSEFSQEDLDNLTEYPLYQEIIKEWIDSLENPEETNEDSLIPGSFPLQEPAFSPKPLKRARSFDNSKKKSKEEPITTDLTKELSKKVRDLQKQVKALKVLTDHRQEALEREKQAVITLAKKKLTNKKESKELLAQLQTNWTEEKTNLIAEHSQEKDELITDRDKWKDSFTTSYALQERYKGSADYLKEKLTESENHLANTNQELVEAKEQIQQQEADYAEQFEIKEQELTNRQESLKVIQERNTDLQSQLANKDQEITKLTAWINKLESASAEGNAWERLQQELAQNSQTINLLQEQLTLKHPTNYYWVYALALIVIIYLALR